MNEKEKLSVTVSPNMIKWLDEMVEKGDFASRSHGVELSLRRYKESLEELEKLKKERRAP